MREAPLISIIIPVYNGSDYLGEAIESALAQTYSNIEIIVVNDGSNDDGKTDDVANSYGDKIRYFRKENGGVSSALNFGISHMRGEYFSWLSHDDKYANRKLETQINLLKNYPNQCVVSLCESCFIDKNSKAMKSKAKKRFDSEYIESTHALTEMFDHGTYNGCAFLIPKKCFDECGVFDERLRFAQDTLMWAKMFLNGYKIVYTSEAGILSRIHDNQQTQKSRHLLKKDSMLMAEYIVPVLEANDYKDALYLFAKRNAKLNNAEVVRFCIKTNKISAMQRFLLRLNLIYGKIRPNIRRLYYAVFRKTKTV